MNIGLIDVDGHNFPNFALMRASAYHKTKGDQVEWATPFSRYDKVMASKVFTFTPDFNYLNVSLFLTNEAERAFPNTSPAKKLYGKRILGINGVVHQ